MLHAAIHTISTPLLGIPIHPLLEPQVVCYDIKLTRPNFNTIIVRTLVFEWYLVGVNLRIIIKKHAFKRDWTMCSNYVNYSRLNGNH